MSLMDYPFLTIAFGIFAILFIYSTVKSLKSYMKNLEFELTQPNEKSKCPDYWDINLDTKGNIKCIDIQNLGNNLLNSQSIPQCTEPGFANESIQLSDDISKCNWSKQCNIPWTGYDKLC
jgi:hypothetical protein